MPGFFASLSFKPQSVIYIFGDPGRITIKEPSMSTLYPYVGGMTGPAIASVFMTVLGVKGIFVFNAVSCLMLAWAGRWGQKSA